MKKLGYRIAAICVVWITLLLGIMLTFLPIIEEKPEPVALILTIPLGILWFMLMGNVVVELWRTGNEY